jgi:hypothetical protein
MRLERGNRIHDSVAPASTYALAFVRKSKSVFEGDAISTQISGATSRGDCSRRSFQNPFEHQATSGANTPSLVRTPTSTRVRPPSCERSKWDNSPARPPCSVFTGDTTILPQRSRSSFPTKFAKRGSSRISRQRTDIASASRGCSMTSGNRALMFSCFQIFGTTASLRPLGFPIKQWRRDAFGTGPPPIFRQEDTRKDHGRRDNGDASS